jgi:hypothetical protein
MLDSTRKKFYLQKSKSMERFWSPLDGSRLDASRTIAHALLHDQDE